LNRWLSVGGGYDCGGVGQRPRSAEKSNRLARRLLYGTENQGIPGMIFSPSSRRNVNDFVDQMESSSGSSIENSFSHVSDSMFLMGVIFPQKKYLVQCRPLFQIPIELRKSR
jgi:hypothetical protein